jgi:hypothetical protein
MFGFISRGEVDPIPPSPMHVSRKIDGQPQGCVIVGDSENLCSAGHS